MNISYEYLLSFFFQYKPIAVVAAEVQHIGNRSLLNVYDHLCAS